MRKMFVVFGFILLASALLGCSNSDKAQEASTQTNGGGGAAQPAGTPMQFRAVCIEKAEHGGNEYVLSKWFDSREKADELGKYHGDFKYKGHRWRIDERTKPVQTPQ